MLHLRQTEASPSAHASLAENRERGTTAQQPPVRIARIVIPYLLFSALWVLGSDLLVDALISNPQVRTQVSIIKGWVFVAATAFVIYLLLKIEARRLARSLASQRESERKYREIFEATGDAILLCDARGVVLERNASARGLFDPRRIADPEGRTLSGFCSAAPPFSAIEFAGKLEEALGGEACVFEWLFSRSDGTSFWAEVSLRMRSKEQGAPLICVARDITRRRAMEEQLRLSEAKFGTVFRGYPDILFISSFESGVIVDANERFLEYFGGRAAVIGKTTLELDIWASLEDRRRYLASMNSNQGHVTDFPVRCRFGGEERDFLISGFVLTVGGEKMLLSSARDVTELRAAEQALRESEARYKLIADNSDDVIWLFDLKAECFTFVSPSIQRLRGYTSEEVRRQSLQDMLTPESFHVVQEQFPARLEALVAGDARAAVRTDRIDQPRKDGSVVNTEVISRILTNSDGAPTHILGVSRDITARAQAERELVSIRYWLERAEKIGHVGGWSLDLDKKRIWASEEARHIYGLPEGVDFDFAYIQALPLPDYRLKLDRAMEALIEKGTPYDLEFEVRRASDGAIVVIHSVAEYDPAAKFVYGVIQDVTARRRIERKNQELATLLDIANDAIYVRDLAHRIDYWNRSAERIYGWTRAEAVGRLSGELFAKGRESNEQIQDALIEHGSWSGERRHFNKKGEGVIVFSRLTLVRDAQGKPAAIMAIDTDITERKQLEVQFLRAQRLESLGALSSGIAHDLNNVLSPILLAAPLLRDEVHSKLGETILASLESSARRGADVVKQVLAFARGAEGEKRLLRPDTLLTEMQKIILETFPKNIHVSVLEMPEIWPIMADPTQVHQALMNLCVNARDAMPNGGSLILSVENLETDERSIRKYGNTAPGPYVLFLVRDTGMGIPQEYLDKIFDPFFTTKPLGKGTGLGLATVLGILKGHHGFVSVDSEPGQGTCFVLGFPADPKQKETVAAAKGETAPPRGDGETLLLVDDEPAVRETIQRLLEKYGYRVIAASDGAEAVGIFAQNREKIDLVLTDMMMPGMDGPSLIRIIRRITPELCVVGMSGVGDIATLNTIASLHLDAFINKPCTEDSLLGTLKRVLRRHAQISC